MKRQLESGGERVVATLGYPGGNQKGLALYWHARHALWCHLNDELAKNRFWICFGAERPDGRTSNSITVELNPPREGVNRRTAGVFLEDGSRVFVAHSGKVGGGKKGIGKDSFMRWYDGKTVSVVWPDGEENDLVVIGCVESPELPSQVARFVHKVREFKSGGEPTGGNQSDAGDGVFFTPEFRGRVLRAAVGARDVECSHGHVVDALKLLFDEDYLVGNDKQRDLYCALAGGKPTALFEVKTDASTSAIYQAVGQLMVHGANDEVCVAVLPDEPIGRLSEALRRLDIEVLVYQLSDGEVRFFGAEELRRRLRRAGAR